MIDIHCHIVPNFDDGPSGLDEAMKMIDMAYEDGIRAILATSHRNHRIDFKAKESYESSFERLSKLVKERYEDMEVYRGAELYLRENYLELFDSVDYDITLNGTDYVLLEFPRDVEYDELANAVHEFRVRGYKPILAHIEMYEALVDNLEGLRALKGEGAYLQITGSSLIGKQGKETMNRLRELVKRNYIDFIASDGHTPSRRRPLLSKAYQMVCKDCSEQVARRIFVENPRALIAGEAVETLTIRSRNIRTSRKSLNTVASVAAVLVIALAGAFTFGGRGPVSESASSYSGGIDGLLPEGLAEEDSNDDRWSPRAIVSRLFARGDSSAKGSVTKGEKNLDDVRADAGGQEPNHTTSKQSDSEQGKGNSTTTSKDQAGDGSSSDRVSGSEDRVEGSPSNGGTTQAGSSKSAIESRYRSRLGSYESQYESQLASKASKIREAQNSIADPAERARAIEGYANEISRLESSADNNVYSALYDMQNELEAGGHDVSSVHSLRSEYQQKKEQAKQRYIN